MLLYLFEATFVLDKNTTVKFQPTWLQCTPYQVSISLIGKVPLYRVHFIVGPTFPIWEIIWKFPNLTEKKLVWNPQIAQWSGFFAKV